MLISLSELFIFFLCRPFLIMFCFSIPLFGLFIQVPQYFPYTTQFFYFFTNTQLVLYCTLSLMNHISFISCLNSSSPFQFHSYIPLHLFITSFFFVINFLLVNSYSKAFSSSHLNFSDVT